MKQKSSAFTPSWSGSVITPYKVGNTWLKLQDGENIRCTNCPRPCEWADNNGSPGKRIACPCESLRRPRFMMNSLAAQAERNRQDVDFSRKISYSSRLENTDESSLDRVAK